jgi:hypothetical protein
MKNRTTTASKNACAYSAAVIADAQAAIVRAIECVRHAGDTRKELKKQRESLERAKAR